MDAKTVVDMLEPMIGGTDRLVQIGFRQATHGYLSNGARFRKSTDDPATVSPILAVTERDGLVQIDTEVETMLFDPADIQYIQTASLAAVNRVAT
jgi:hypothetical protein